MNAAETYFSAERTESLFFVLVGLLALGAALWFWSHEVRPAWRCELYLAMLLRR